MQRAIVALTMIAASAVCLSFLFSNDAVVATLRVGAGVPLVAALILALMGQRRKAKRTTAERFKAGATVIGAFVAGALAFGYVTDVQEGSQADDRSFDVELSESVATIPVSRIEVEVTEERTEQVLDDAEPAMTALEVIGGHEADQLIAAAQDVRYEPRVASDLDWAASVVERAGATWLVTVPAAATDDPVLNKVVFLTNGATSTVMEYSGRLIDAATLHFEIWQDGLQIKNIDAVNPAASANGGIAQVFDWDAFNRCLSNQGISYALLTAIGLACSAVCAFTVGLGCPGCLAFAAGGWSGLVLGCYRQAA